MEAQTFTVFEVCCHIILFMMYGFIHSSKGFYGDITDLIFILFKDWKLNFWMHPKKLFSYLIVVSDTNVISSTYL